jgi:aminoglycoside phosphotransferase (APT) family kinase protein
MADIEQIKADLVNGGLLAGWEITITPLTGGVSSDIHLVSDGARKLIVKQALAELKVDDLWQVDVSRNLTEQEYLCHVSTFLPDNVPRIVHSDRQLNYFAMEYLDGFRSWKSHLLAGEADINRARQAGEILGRIHRQTRDDRSLLDRFDTTGSFHALRTEPYLLTTAERNPLLAHWIEAEASRLESTRLCLVHGDYSPKNIMIGSERMVLLDCEVAWYGDPAFDTAFLFNHFLLKALLMRGEYENYISLVPAAWEAYSACQTVVDEDIAERTGRLLLMLMLARVDGKSPVEYLSDGQKCSVREFVNQTLPRGKFGLEDICRRWARWLETMKGDNGQ